MAPIRLDYTKRIIALVTGTSQGIGKAIAEHLGSKLVSGSKLIAITNTTNYPGEIDMLNELKSRNPEVYFDIHLTDLSYVDVGTYTSVVDKFIQHPAVRDRRYVYGLIIHNAGSLGEIEFTTKMQNMEKWVKYYNLNFFSPVLLNTIFISKCKPYTKHIFVVNITSIYSIRMQPKLSMYCTVKAARNAYFSCLAAEEPDVSVMNYSPGPVKTAMLDALPKKQLPVGGDVKIITPDEAVCKMLDTLTTANYTSGGFFDYYGRNT